jgi:acetoin utilization protein AcuB
MFIYDHMTPSPITVTPEQTVAEAIAMLEKYNIRHLPVVDEQGVLQGILSDRDLRSARPSTIVRTKLHGSVEEQVNNLKIGVLMTRDLLYLAPYNTLDDALLLFESRKIGALPVVNDEGKLVGVFTVADLMNAYRDLFGLGAKGSVLISIEDDGDPQALRKLVQIMEEKQVQFTRLVRAEGTDKRKPMIYLRINAYNIRSVHKSLEAGGFVVHVPEKTL